MWEQIRSNQVKSAVLVALMGLVLLALGYFLGEIYLGDAVPGLIIAFAVWAIMNLVAYYQGSSILLGISGARKITRDDHPRLYNVVEEMKIASGLEKMPDVYIIDDPALNAFSTGRDANHASVAITSGLLQKLNRDELQGVMGHEIAHIQDKDVMLMTMLSVTLGAIVLLSWYASRFLFLAGGSGGSRRSSSSSGGGGGQIIIVVIGLVLMILAPIFAQLIYFAVSRRREYLADAQSALYTRYPEGLASALEKLATSDSAVRAANRATAPMYIINPFQKRGMSVDSLTATHPPIAERVRILRSMAGASLAEYEAAYHKMKGQGGHAVPASALATAGADAMSLRGPSEDAGPVGVPDKIAQARETSDLMYKLNNYRTITCACGTRLRIPPEYRAAMVRCPHCGRINPL